MKITLYISIIFSLFISCSNNNKNNQNRELLAHPEKYVQDNYKAETISFQPDTTISRIALLSDTNIQSYLGEKVMDRLNNEVIPSSYVLSKDKKQRLDFFFHPGSSTNTFAEFRVSYTSTRTRSEYSVNDINFSTESGIKLGITEGTLKAVKGEPDSIDNSTYYYRITDRESPVFLDKYKMPIYYANYTFENGYLIQFRFGFEYP